MRNITISLLELPAAARDPARTAAAAAFPGPEVIERTTMDGLRRDRGTPGLELLVMGDGNPDCISQATQAVDEAGLPRWAVVILGREASEFAETVPPEEWNPGLLTRVFRAALLEHELLRENLRMRGDLKTVARRFSHDLITPVGCINTSACVLKIIPPEETESIASIIQNIEVSSAEISQLIERMSFVVRASTDADVPVEVAMGEVVAAVLKQLEPEIQRTGATVVLPPSWPKAAGISKWVHVIWWNLLGNALKHGGKAPRIQVDWQAEGSGFRFSVADNGAGVIPAILPGIFRPFDQLHTGHTIGLGLSIVQRLVDLQGGSCGYEGLAEGGARFFFSLPAAKP